MNEREFDLTVRRAARKVLAALVPRPGAPSLREACIDALTMLIGAIERKHNLDSKQ